MPDSSAAILESSDKDFAPLISKIHVLSEAGRYGEALALVSAELSRHPTDGELFFARASVWFDWGRVREAYAGFLQAEANGMGRTALYLNLAWSRHLLGMANEAEPYARKAIDLDPANVAGHFGLGTILQRLKRYPEAIASYERALELSPGYAQATAGIAHCKLEQHEYVDAEAWMRRAVALAPESPQFRTNLGVAIANQERYVEALAVLKQAGDLESARGVPRESIIDVGFALLSTGQNDAATELYRHNLPNLPDPRAHGHYAFVLLERGQLLEGWSQYEFRWMQDPHLSRRPNFPQPTWAGQDLAGKTILLLAEQGAGDIIHFARFALPLKAMGATVVLQVRPELAQLAKGFDGVDIAFAPPTPPPPFDYHIPLMSIPNVFGIELATIPADVPYLRVDRDKTQRWAARIDERGLKIGLAWAGNPAYARDRFRSVPLDALSNLWDLQGVHYFSLQKPLKSGELEQFPPETVMVNLDPDLADFADTAAAIAQLDLVICVDTAIAHLAGALGKPVWLMLPEFGDFRWLQEREDSPWYPTMRLFRQRRLGEWSEVVARVKAALLETVRTGLLPEQSVAAPTPTQSAKVVTGVGARMLARIISAEPRNIAQVTETRYGIMQYLPDAGRPAQSIAWYGEYLQPQLDLLSRLIRQGAHVVEAGSGVGEHAIALAKMAGAQGHLWIYEARPIARQILRQNLDVNRVAGNVSLMRRDLAGSQELSREHREATSRVADATLSANNETSADTLDALLLDRLDLLKIRLDAVAADILDGATASLWRLRPMVLIAARDDVALTKLAAQVKEFGYRCWRMESPLFNPDNFNRRATDIFDAETALALVAIPEEADVSIALDGCVEMTDAFGPNHVTPNLLTEMAQETPPDATETVENARLGLMGKLRKLLR